MLNAASLRIFEGVRSALAVPAWLGLCIGLWAQASSFPTGVVIPKVECVADSSQSYALYLPLNYSATRKWPILYMFDPAARGQVAVETAQAAAEKFGYIVVASNNSRNGLQGGSSEAMLAVWRDTHARFPVDERRRYSAGMSGGARVAAGMALGCPDCLAGVISNAAGFPGQAAPPRDMKFAYFAAIGDADFNYPELAELRKKLEAAGARYRIRVFEGEHGYAPPEIWMEALEWMDLQAMLSGALPRDPERVRASLDRQIARARGLKAMGHVLEAARTYQFIVRDFASLATVDTVRNELAELDKDKSLKRAEHAEADSISEQVQLTQEASQQMRTISSGELSPVGFARVRGVIADLRRKVDSAKDPSGVLVERRALGGLVVEAFEAGQTSMDEKKHDNALDYFALAGAGAKHPEWSHYQRARAYAMKSDKKGMLSELKQAIALGMRDASALDAEEFRAYREQPQFQALVEELRARPQQQ